MVTRIVECEVKTGSIVKIQDERSTFYRGIACESGVWQVRSHVLDRGLKGTFISCIELVHLDYVPQYSKLNFTPSGKVYLSKGKLHIESIGKCMYANTQPYFKGTHDVSISMKGNRAIAIQIEVNNVQ